MRDAGTRGRLALCRRPSDPVSLGHSGVRILLVGSATDNSPPLRFSFLLVCSHSRRRWPNQNVSSVSARQVGHVIIVMRASHGGTLIAHVRRTERRVMPVGRRTHGIARGGRWVVLAAARHASCALFLPLLVLPPFPIPSHPLGERLTGSRQRESGQRKRCRK